MAEDVTTAELARRVNVLEANYVHKTPWAITVENHSQRMDRLENWMTWAFRFIIGTSIMIAVQSLAIIVMLVKTVQ